MTGSYRYPTQIKEAYPETRFFDCDKFKYLIKREQHPSFFKKFAQMLDNYTAAKRLEIGESLAKIKLNNNCPS